MDWLWPLVVFLFPLAYSPGPGNMVFAAIGARDGLIGSVPASLGYHLATFVVTVLTGFGFAVIAAALPGLFTALTWAGVVYTLWLASVFLRAGPATDTTDYRPLGITGGAVLLLLNPKAWVILGLMFSQFLPAEQASPARVLLISAVFTLNNLIAFAVWALAGQAIARLFAGARAHLVNRGFGLSLIGVAVWMALR